MVEAAPASKALGPLEASTYETIDPRFTACRVADARVERIWTGGQWTEGPAWLADRTTLIWSEIPSDTIWAWQLASGKVSIFRQPANGPNGNTVDRQGRLVSCEQTPHRITRTEPDGSITILVDTIDGRRFQSPNDIVVKSDGSIWFTDPSYGRPEDRRAGPDVEGCHVYRLDPSTGVVRKMTSDFVMPNGLAFSPDETMLYVVDTGSTQGPDHPNHVRSFTLGWDDSLSGGGILAASKAQRFDGLRVDTKGRLWMADNDGIHCYLPDGTLIGRVCLPERASNLTFGGPDRNMLMMTASTSVYICPVNATGTAP